MLIRKIEKFLSETGMAWTKFGRLATRDPRFADNAARFAHNHALATDLRKRVAEAALGEPDLHIYRHFSAEERT